MLYTGGPQMVWILLGEKKKTDENNIKCREVEHIQNVREEIPCWWWLLCNIMPPSYGWWEDLEKFKWITQKEMQVCDMCQATSKSNLTICICLSLYDFSCTILNKGQLKKSSSSSKQLWNMFDLSMIVQYSTWPIRDLTAF